MLAILLEDDQHSREVMISLLNSIGYESVLCASSIEEATYFFKQNSSQIRLIISAHTSNMGPDLPLSRLIIQNRALDLIPLLLVTNDSMPKKLPVFYNRLSRVDDLLSRPFGLNRLKASIEFAHHRRAELRSTLFYLGSNHGNELAEAVYAGSKQFHWKKVINTLSLQELVSQMKTVGFSFGGVIIDEDMVTDALVDWAKAFKKAHLGALTPICVLGRDPNKIKNMRTVADLFCEQNEYLNEMLSLISNRLFYQWEMRDQIKEIRELIKQQKFSSAKKMLSKVSGLDPERWEILELEGSLAMEEGRIEDAIERFESAMVTQPCSAFSHLSLLTLTGNDRVILERALSFCPHHPEILRIASNMNLEVPAAWS